ncbi:MAG: type II secretion system ATPase GspE [bacterium]
MRFDARPLEQILLEKTSLDPKGLEAALSLQKERGGALGDILVTLKLVTDEDVCEAVSRQMNLAYWPEIPDQSLDLEILRNIPINFCKKHELLPLKKDGGAVQVAVADPLNVAPLDDLQLLLKEPVRPILARATTILHAINRAYDLISETAEQMVEGLNEEALDLVATELEEPKDLLDASDEAPIIRLVNSVLYQAVKQRASDVHIEPFERQLVIRYRIDGVLYDMLRPSKRFQSSVASRVKIMAGLNIAEKRLPQDGRIRIKIAGKDVDIRVSVVPTAHGERIVMRLLDRSQVLLKLDEIGMTGDKLLRMRKLIRMPYGILLETGPTGSGKTTTLYAALSEINTPEKNIITVEDPIEYQLHGVGQIQVNPKIELTFARGLRSILRQDPDVIMVGEIRDLETAEIAIQASLTGHLVFSTLHTNDAPTAITRLVDMGIEPFLVSSSLIGALAQRLVRILCPACKEPYVASDETLRELHLERDRLPNGHLYRPKGCAKCAGTGYYGRSGIYELLVVDEKIQHLILKGVDANVIRRAAIERGMTPLRDDGAEKVLRGITSAEEVARVTQETVV